MAPKTPYSDAFPPTQSPTQIEERLTALEALIPALSYLLEITTFEVQQICNIDVYGFSTERWAYLSNFVMDEYYTEDEVDTLLASKSDLAHVHDDRYSQLSHTHDSRYSQLSHTHDSRYYTESEITTFLSGKANSSHTHAEADLSLSDITTNDANTSRHGFLKKLPNTATSFLDGTGAFDTVKDSDLSTSDITTNNASATKHGFLKKLSNDAGQYMDGAGNWTNPCDWGVSTVTSSVALSDSKAHRFIYVNPDETLVTITLPQVANNTGMHIYFKKGTIDGHVTINAYGSELIGGIWSEFSLYDVMDFIHLMSDGTTWAIVHHQLTFNTGFIKRNDWTDVLIGSFNVNIDNKSGSFIKGEIIKEYSDAARTLPTGAYGTLVVDFSSTYIILRNAQGSGFFTNNYYLRGETSLATAQVNGTTKNVDAAIHHLMGVSLADVDITIYINSTATKENAYVYQGSSGNSISSHGFLFNELGEHFLNCTIQTGSAGIDYINSSGATQVIDTEDWFAMIIFKWTS